MARIQKTHLAFFAIVLVMLEVVFFVVVVQLVAVTCRNANLSDEAVPLLLVHQSYVLKQRRDFLGEPNQRFTHTRRRWLMPLSQKNSARETAAPGILCKIVIALPHLTLK